MLFPRTVVLDVVPLVGALLEQAVAVTMKRDRTATSIDRSWRMTPGVQETTWMIRSELHVQYARAAGTANMTA